MALTATLLAILQDNMLTVVIFTILAFLIRKVMQWPKNLPPGPRQYFTFGKPHEGTIEDYAISLSKKYNSDIVSVRFGVGKLYVFLNSIDIIREAFIKKGELTSGRPNFFYKEMREHSGVLFSEGPLWKEQRRFTLSALRDFGMGKMAIQDKIQDEMIHVKEHLAKMEGKSFDPQALVRTAVSNITCLVMLGKRFDYEDKMFQEVSKTFSEHAGQTNASSMLNIVPLIRKLPRSISGAKWILDKYDLVDSFIRSFLVQHKKNLDADNINDFIDAYLVEIEKKNKLSANHWFSEKQLHHLIGDLFLAGTETTSTTLRWAISLMVNYPDIQEKLQAEIDDVIGDRLPTMADKNNMPYTNAVILELQRFSSIVAVGVPHIAEADLEIAGYTIPKGATLLGNIYGVHRDPRIWQYPEEFNPGNFMDDDGKIRNQENLIPFLIGKRSCAGESLAKMELFIFFVKLMQDFTIKPPESGQLPPLTGEFAQAAVRMPAAYDIRMYCRNK